LRLPDGRKADQHDKYLQIAWRGALCIATAQTQPLEYLGQPYSSDGGGGYARKLTELFVQKLGSPLVFAGDFCTDNGAANPAVPFADMCDRLDITDALPACPTRFDGVNHPDAIFVSRDLPVIDGGIVVTETDHFLCWAEISLPEMLANAGGKV
jgi:hypothetical protein